MSAPEALSLRVLQRWFVGMTTSSALDFDGDSRVSRVVEQWIKSAPGQPAKDRLEIYRDGYFSRLVECLADDYPVLRACMGELEFEGACRRYAEAHPSCDPNLNRFGQRFPEFVATIQSDHRHFLFELAQFEWALVECVHARADERFLESLRLITPERLMQLRFIPSDSLRLFVFEYPVNRAVQRYFDVGTCEVPVAESTRVGIARRAMDVWRVDLDEHAYQVVSRLVQGQPLAEALRGLAVTADELRGWFATWVNCGFFNRIEAA